MSLLTYLITNLLTYLWLLFTYLPCPCVKACQQPKLVTTGDWRVHSVRSDSTQLWSLRTCSKTGRPDSTVWKFAASVVITRSRVHSARCAMNTLMTDSIRLNSTASWVELSRIGRSEMGFNLGRRRHRAAPLSLSLHFYRHRLALAKICKMLPTDNSIRSLFFGGGGHVKKLRTSECYSVQFYIICLTKK